MSKLQELGTRAREGFERLTPREQKLLGVLALVLLVMGGGFFLYSYLNKASTLRTGIQERRDAISTVIAARPLYAQRVEEQRRIDETLDNNTLSIASFIETLARQHSITRPRDFRDSQQPVSDRPDLTADSTVVVFPEMNPAQLTDIARGIKESNHLLYIQRLKLDTRPRQNGYEVELTLTTLRRNDGGTP